MPTINRQTPVRPVLILTTKHSATVISGYIIYISTCLALTPFINEHDTSTVLVVNRPRCVAYIIMMVSQQPRFFFPLWLIKSHTYMYIYTYALSKIISNWALNWVWIARLGSPVIRCQYSHDSHLQTRTYQPICGPTGLNRWLIPQSKSNDSWWYMANLRYHVLSCVFFLWLASICIHIVTFAAIKMAKIELNFSSRVGYVSFHFLLVHPPPCRFLNSYPFQRFDYQGFWPCCIPVYPRLQLLVTHHFWW